MTIALSELPDLPFATPAQFERALAPYYGDTPRKSRRFIFTHVPFSAPFHERVLYVGLDFMDCYRHSLTTGNPRLKFRGTFREYLHRELTAMDAGTLSTVDRVIASFYGIVLPPKSRQGEVSAVVELQRNAF